MRLIHSGYGVNSNTDSVPEMAQPVHVHFFFLLLLTYAMQPLGATETSCHWAAHRDNSEELTAGMRCLPCKRRRLN